MSRFSRRRVFANRADLYDQMAEERGVKYFRQLETPNFRYPTSDELRGLTIVKHVWKAGDKFYKLAHEHYGDSTLWWVIAWYNKTPTESHLTVGSMISIPTPVQKLLRYLRNK